MQLLKHLLIVRSDGYCYLVRKLVLCHFCKSIAKKYAIAHTLPFSLHSLNSFFVPSTTYPTNTTYLHLLPIVYITNKARAFARALLLLGGNDLLSHFRSTIGAVRFNFSVRNGKRWSPHAVITLMSFAISLFL